MAEEGMRAGGPTPSGFLPTARSGNLGETCHMLAAESQAGRGSHLLTLLFLELLSPPLLLALPPPGLQTSSLFSSPEPWRLSFQLKFKLLSSSSSYSAQRREPSACRLLGARLDLNRVCVTPATKTGSGVEWVL